MTKLYSVFYGRKWLAVFFWMKQSKAGTGNLKQDLFFSCSCFLLYTASLTEGQVVLLHSNSFFNSFWITFQLTLSISAEDLEAQGTPRVLVTKHSAIQRSGIARVHVQRGRCGDGALEGTGHLKQGAWERNCLPGLTLHAAAQVKTVLHWQAAALVREPVNKSPKFIKYSTHSETCLLP